MKLNNSKIMEGFVWRRPDCSFLSFTVYSRSPDAFGYTKVRPSASIMALRTFCFLFFLPRIHWNQPGCLSTGEMATLPAGTGKINCTFKGCQVFLTTLKVLCCLRMQCWRVTRPRWFWCFLSPPSPTSTLMSCSSIARRVGSTTTPHTWWHAFPWMAAAPRSW